MPEPVIRAEGVVFNLDGSKPVATRINHGQQLTPSAIPKFYPLNGQQLEALLTWIRADNGLLEVGLSKCFIPRHGFIFYNANDEVIGSVSVCFECEAFRRNPQKNSPSAPKRPTAKSIKKAMKRLEDLKQLTKSIGLPVLENPDQNSRQPQFMTVNGRLQAKIDDGSESLNACMQSTVAVSSKVTVVWSGERINVSLGNNRQLSDSENNCLKTKIRELSATVYQHASLSMQTIVTVKRTSPSNSETLTNPTSRPLTPTGP